MVNLKSAHVPLLLLLVIQVLFPYCPFPDIPNSLVLPSVIHDEHDNPITGEPMSISLYFSNGNGTIHISESASIAPDTLESIRFALSKALEFSGKGEYASFCDLHVSIASQSSTTRALNISGPSGGAGFFVLILAELEGRALRSDSSITGTIASDFSLGSVGNYYEKAAYLLPRIKFLVIPKLSLMDQLLLYKFITGNSSVSIIEAENATDAYLFLSNQKSLSPKTTILAISENLNSSKLRDITSRFYGLSKFSSMVSFQISKLESSISKSSLPPELKSYFLTRLENNKLAYSKGYYYTAGNDLFLLETEILMSEAAASGDLDSYLRSTMSKVQNCIDQTSSAGLGVQDPLTIDMYSGISVRLFWAEKNLEALNFSKNRERQIQIAKDLGYAYGWCEYSRNLLDQINSDYKASSTVQLLSMSSLSPAVKKLLEVYSSYNSSWNSDMRKYYLYSYESYLRGDNLAALYNFYFAKSIDDYLQNSSTEKLNSQLELMLSHPFKSFWGKVYATQMHYLYDMGDNGSAARLGHIALNMDAMAELMASSAEFRTVDIGSSEAKDIPLISKSCISPESVLFFAAICSLLSALVVFILCRSLSGTTQPARHSLLNPKPVHHKRKK